MHIKGIWAAGLVLLMILPVVSVLPMAAGDGIPGYVISGDEDPEKVFKSIFESNQLARVDYLGAGQQRISLFLSVFSLDPGRNLTIMVPMRTLPSSVTGEPIKEAAFRREFKLNRAEEEIIRQDPDVAWEKVGDETSSAMGLCLGSLLMSYPIEYLRQNVHREESEFGAKLEDGAGGGVWALDGERGLVQHHEFDGFSIDVFDVSGGPMLEEYLAEKGIVIPEGGGLSSYNSQYVAIVEARMKPPINETDFQLLRMLAPEVIEAVSAKAQDQPALGDRARWYFESELEGILWDIVDEKGLDSDMRADLFSITEDLVEAVFGYTNSEGEVVHVDLPLDQGNMFFPLGTSAGWPNEVGTIDVLFQVPQDKRLRIVDSKDAYFDGKHWYLFQMVNARPGFDLESSVMDSDGARLKQANRAAWLNDNSETTGSLIAAFVVISLWFGCAFALKRHYSLKGKVVRDPQLWVLLGLALFISIAGALLVLLLWQPVPIKEALKRVPVAGMAAMWPLVAVVFIFGGFI